MPLKEKQKTRLQKVFYRTGIGLLCVVIYLASIPVVLVAGYWVKNQMHVDTIQNGGWHHFNHCLTAELEGERYNLSVGKWGALAPLAPLLVSLGVVAAPQEGAGVSR